MAAVCFKNGCGYMTRKKGDKKAFCMLPRCPYMKRYEPKTKQNETKRVLK